MPWMDSKIWNKLLFCGSHFCEASVPCQVPSNDRHTCQEDISMVRYRSGCLPAVTGSMMQSFLADDVCDLKGF